MLEIPAGIFLMGSRMSHGSPEEHPMHEVAIAAFFLDKTEVTTGAYMDCVTRGACTKPYENHVLCNVKHAAERKDHPMNCVDYGQAEKYCQDAGKRLPTEREWEYAARGGAEQRRFSWGEEDIGLEERACYHHPGTCPVASFKPGAFGLYDMSGNVWEWTATWFGPYPDEPITGTHRVYRGGSFSRRFPKWLQNGLRNRYLPEERSASLGFRCAQSITPLRCPPDTELKGETCVRVRGTPLCEPGFSWNGQACVLPGTSASSAPAASKPQTSNDAAPTAETHEKPRAPQATDPVSRERTPKYDRDCQTNWPKKPFAYKFSGATFHARNRPLEAAHCTRRDMGLTWTSACCPE